jgi:hypothetical protein
MVGRFETASPESLVLLVDGERRQLPASSVGEVRTRRQDAVWNGLIIGAAVGALAGLIPDYYDDCEECHDSLYLSFAVGAGVGVVIDLLRQERRLVYAAPSRTVSWAPVLRPGAAGVQFAVNFK